jgi:hypothetical protein
MLQVVLKQAVTLITTARLFLIWFSFHFSQPSFSLWSCFGAGYFCFSPPPAASRSLTGRRHDNQERLIFQKPPTLIAVI